MKEKRIEELREEIREQLESDCINNLDDYSWLVDHCHDYFDDSESILKSFIDSYKPSNVYAIMNFSNDYESSEAEEIIKILGSEKTVKLIMDHTYITQDYDIYHSHWNDIATADWSEYEYQIDNDRDSGIEKEFFDLLGSEKDASEFFYLDLGMIRMKLDVENFEKALYKEHNIHVTELGLGDDDSTEAV